MATKKTPKIRQKAYGRRADETKSHKIENLQWKFQKNANLGKNRKNYDLLGQLSQKIENYMSRYYTLLAISSTNAPVVLRISP